MSVTLTQSTTASFLDRPSSGNGNTGIGLLVTMLTGTNSQYVQHDLGSGQAILHTRVMFNAATVTGGSVVILLGRDAAGVEIWRMTYDASTKALTVLLVTTDTLTATLTALPWQCIELKVDTAGTAELWINGVSAATASGSYGSLSTRYVWLGGIAKSSTTTGAVYLDEWVIGTSYIGPVVVTPTSPYADDPARWLVVYNVGVADSVTWVESYRAARGIPYANLCGLSLSTNESIASGDWATMRTAIALYLSTQSSLAIAGILLGYSVPGVAQMTPDRSTMSLTMDLSSDTADATNPLYQSSVTTLATLPARTTLVGAAVYLVAQIDGPSLSAVQALTTLADAMSTTATDKQVLSSLDPATDKVGMAATGWAALTAYLASIESQEIRLPTVAGYDGTTHGNSIEMTDVTAGAFSVAGQAEAMLLTIGNSTADVVRSGTDLIKLAIDNNYPVAYGHVGTVSSGQHINPAPFMAALRAGWTLGEALAISVPVINSTWRIIGDPLAVLPMPLQGFEVLDDVSGQLYGVVPGGVTQLDLTGAGLADGEHLLKVVQADRYGCRSDGALVGVTVGGGVVTPRWRMASQIQVEPQVGGQFEISFVTSSLPASGLSSDQVVYAKPGEYEVATVDLPGVIVGVSLGTQVFHSLDLAGTYVDKQTVVFQVRASDGVPAGQRGVWVQAMPAVADSQGPAVPDVIPATGVGCE